MKHYGDITKINGAAVEAVDVICGGSPCQDLSVAGKRAGLAGARSGLFMDQIRIIKEMRNNVIRLHSGGANNNLRYMVWENVCGAFSSNGGEDFRAVLEETCRVVDENACVPKLDGRKWPNAGCIVGNVGGAAYSIAWRLHNSEFWGVAQRRRRIALVADFGGETAAEVLFEYESMSGNSEPRRQKEIPAAGNSARSAACTGEAEAIIIDNHQTDNRFKICEDNICPTLSARMGTGGNNGPVVLQPLLLESTQKHGQIITDGIAPTLLSRMGTGGNNGPVEKRKNVLRRLTPKEAERLQGFPDNWTLIPDWIDSKGKLHKGDSDSPRYKALGNSIALPFWQWLAERIAKHLPQGATMASLFDGIGGFPLVFSRAGVRPVWASEIEEFPIAVTKYHFPETEE